VSGVFLVGATGPLGRAIARELAGRGHAVQGISRSGGLGSTPLDVTDTKLLRIALRAARPAAVIDLSKPELPESGTADAAVDGALAAHRQFLTTCAEEGVARLVFASSAAVYGTSSAKPHAEGEPLPPAGTYARLKSGSELNLSAAADSGAFAELALALRIFNIYGPGFSNSLVTRLVERTHPAPTVYVSDAFVRDYIYSGDVARAIVGAIDGPPLGAHVLNLGTGVGTSNNDLLATLPDAIFTASHDLASPSYSVADMTLARETLSLNSFVAVAHAVDRWHDAKN
jgi:UDP-glucose 4-epimerase